MPTTDGVRPGARIAWLGGGGRNKFWKGTKSLFCVNSRGARGHEKFIPVWIRWTKWRAKIQRDFPAEIGNSSGFSGRKQVISKKRSSSQKRHEIRCQSTKNTNLGLDLHSSSSPEPVNFFRAQPLLGGHKFRSGGTSSHLGGHIIQAVICPPWRWVWVESRTLHSRPRQRTKKKFQGQGRTFWGQTLLKPKAEMVEAKDQECNFLKILVGKCFIVFKRESV